MGSSALVGDLPLLAEGPPLISLGNGDELHTIPEAARAFDVSDRTVRRWIKAAGIRVVRGHVSYLALAEAERDAKMRSKTARFAACPSSVLS